MTARPCGSVIRLLIEVIAFEKRKQLVMDFEIYSRTTIYLSLPTSDAFRAGQHGGRTVATCRARDKIVDN